MKNKKICVLTFLVFMLLLIIFYVGNGAPDGKGTSTNLSVLEEGKGLITYDEVSISVGEETFSVLIADTPLKRARGLSGRGELTALHGMLFVFDQPGDYPFWMKDMNFAIDIIWINENNEVVYILEDIKPETYPKSFVSIEKALYVLELPNGTVAKTNIKKGGRLIITK